MHLCMHVYVYVIVYVYIRMCVSEDFFYDFKHFSVFLFYFFISHLYCNKDDFGIK